MKKSILILVCLFSAIVCNGQTKDCKKLNLTEHQRKEGASKYNECCIDDVTIANGVLLKKYNFDSLAKIHCPFGVPVAESKDVVILAAPTYITGYDSINKIPLWVSYKLLKRSEIQKGIGRIDCFRYDPRLPLENQASYNDYDQPGTDTLQRGHLKPSADGYKDKYDNLNTFVMTNMAPQHKTLNMCEWEVLEGFIRDHSQVDSVEQAYVISGSIIDTHSKKLNGKVSIPNGFYKVYYFKAKGKWHYWTYYLDHDWEMMKFDDYKNYLNSERKTIDQIEETGKINFFVSGSDGGVIESELDKTFSLTGLNNYPNWCGTK